MGALASMSDAAGTLYGLSHSLQRRADLESTLRVLGLLGGGLVHKPVHVAGAVVVSRGRDMCHGNVERAVNSTRLTPIEASRDRGAAVYGAWRTLRSG